MSLDSEVFQVILDWMADKVTLEDLVDLVLKETWVLRDPEEFLVWISSYSINCGDNFERKSWHFL